MESIIRNSARLSTEEDFKSHESFKENLNKQLDKDIERPFRYITTIPGNDIKIAYSKVLNYWLNIPEDKLALIDLFTYVIHNSSLLLDDIQDNSTLRRGIPSAHTIFGFANTATAVTFGFDRLTEIAMMLDHPKAMEIGVETLTNGLAGQGLEIYWRDNCICPTEEEYLKMIMLKTGCYFGGITKFTALFSETSFDFTVLVENLGLFFQITDDHNNLTSKLYFDNKGYCDDIREGKFGFPMVHAINTHPEEGKIIMDILRQRTESMELKKYCLSLIEKCGSFEYTKQKLKSFKEIIRQEIHKFGGNNPFAELFLETIFI